MITIFDTNVLVRYLVRDDVEQAEAARALLESLTADAPGYICREVAVELVWVLERAYRFSRDQIATVLEELVVTEGLAIEAADDVARAASHYRAGRRVLIEGIEGVGSGSFGCRQDHQVRQSPRGGLKA